MPCESHRKWQGGDIHIKKTSKLCADQTKLAGNSGQIWPVSCQSVTLHYTSRRTEVLGDRVACPASS